MASVHIILSLPVPPAVVWDAVRDFGAVHERVAVGFVVVTEVDGIDRLVTFVNGAVARERLVTSDDDRRRLVYTVVESAVGFTHHQATVEVREVGDPDRREFAWTADVLPDDVDPTLRVL